MRAPDSYNDAQVIGQDGSHLASTLHRVANSTAGDAPTDVYARVAGRLASLTGLRIRGLRVDADDAREAFTLVLRDESGIELPARSLSEGTLRFLALCVLLEDSTVTGVVCLEEPENGIHPLNVNAIVNLVQDLAVDPSLPPGPDNPMRQVIVNTHSPAVVQLVDPGDLLYADAPIKTEGGLARHALRLRPLQRTWRAAEAPSSIGKTDLIAYLSSPPGAQLTLTPTFTDVA
jgi:predicted ATPase